MEQIVEQSSRRTSLIVVLGGLALIAVVGFFVLTTSNSSTNTATRPNLATSATASLNEFSIDISKSVVKQGSAIEIKNDGSMPHNFYVRGTGVHSNLITSGNSEDLDLKSLKPGSYAVYCNIAGHESAGMKATLTIN